MAQYNFFSLLHRQCPWTIALPDGSVQKGYDVRNIPVRIPEIQRDYALGRETDAIKRKRHSLLNDILDVVYGIRDNLSFDFVYGYGDARQTCPNPTFVPLDGQQRLTTLFLLYWLFGRSADLREQDGHSLFIYETRDTSEEFCHWLVNQEAGTIIPGWECEVSLYRYMLSLSSFKWDWHNDPNIHSMITVLESAVNIIKERNLVYGDGIIHSSNLDNITFGLLDNLVCDGDQLFERMNARGRALTSFEILKSSLEEEMEKQGLPESDPLFVNSWQNAMDGEWIDYCWDNTVIGTDPQLKTVRSVEEKLERLLIRMVGNSQHSTIDFQSIYDDLHNLLYKDADNKWRDASVLLPKYNGSKTLIEEFLGDNTALNTDEMVDRMFAYLRKVPANKIVGNTAEKDKFIGWMKI